MQTAEQEIKMHGERKVLSVKVPEGGTLIVSVLHDTDKTLGTAGDWNIAETYTSDGLHEFYFGTATVKITPAGGATFSIL